MSRSYATADEMNMPFTGAKLALLVGHRIIVILRDDIPTIPFPGYWDLPGGGREAGEPPLVCALRETFEELGLTIRPDVISWGRCFPSKSEVNWFFVAHVPEEIVGSIRFGDEGQRWEVMAVTDFLNHPNAVPNFKIRLAIYLAEERELLRKNPPLI